MKSRHFFFNLGAAVFKAYCAIWVRRSNLHHQASPRVLPRESTQRRKVELWARNVREFCVNADLHVTFRDLLHAVKLRHGTDGFASPPKESVLMIFRPKNPTASAGREPANLENRGLNPPTWEDCPLRTRSGHFECRRISCPFQESNNDFSVVQTVACRTVCCDLLIRLMSLAWIKIFCIVASMGSLRLTGPPVALRR
jgi:hypothetical protein